MSHDAREVANQELFNTISKVAIFLDQGKLVSSTEAVLQEEGAAQAHELAFGHDSDSVSEHISLVHVMRGENDDPVPLVAL